MRKLRWHHSLLLTGERRCNLYHNLDQAVTQSLCCAVASRNSVMSSQKSINRIGSTPARCLRAAKECRRREWFKRKTTRRYYASLVALVGILCWQQFPESAVKNRRSSGLVRRRWSLMGCSGAVPSAVGKHRGGLGTTYKHTPTPASAATVVCCDAVLEI